MSDRTPPPAAPSPPCAPSWGRLSVAPSRRALGNASAHDEMRCRSDDAVIGSRAGAGEAG